MEKDGHGERSFGVLFKLKLINLFVLRLISGPGCQGRLTAPGFEPGIGVRSSRADFLTNFCVGSLFFELPDV